MVFQGLGVAQGRARIEERQTDRQERERCGVLPGLRPCASGLCVRADTPPRLWYTSDMVKLRTPLLSMGAHGTLGGSVTFQGNDRYQIARRKPVLPYSLTLRQQYQRWLYEDYAALWKEQSQATRLVYSGLGYRFHLTGYQYWMKYHLANLPDIIGAWHLDILSSGQTPDSGRNALTGTVVGAYPVPGVIAQGFYFDGVNDHVDIGSSALVKPTETFSIELFILIRALPFVGFKYAVANASSNGKSGFACNGHDATNKVDVYCADALGGVGQAITLVAGAWKHICLTYDNGIIICYADGEPVGAPGFKVISYLPGNILAIGAAGDIAAFWPGSTDHLILRTRLLQQAEVKRHAERRFTLE